LRKEVNKKTNHNQGGHDESMERWGEKKKNPQRITTNKRPTFPVLNPDAGRWRNRRKKTQGETGKTKKTPQQLKSMQNVLRRRRKDRKGGG